MGARFDLVTVDTPRPDDLAGFWSAVLGLVELEREDGDRWIVLGEPSRQRRIGFQRGIHVPGGIHLDLVCEADEFDAELERLATVGAELVGSPRREPYGMIAMFRDPDGNLFDLCSYS